MFLLVSFFMSVYLFHGLVTCLPFFHGQDISFCYTTSENWCSFSRLEYFGFLCHRQEREVFLTSFLHACMSADFTDWYLDYLFHFENVSFCYSICKIFFVSFCLLFPRLSTFLCGLILCLPLSRSEYVVLIHYRLLKPTFDKDRCLHYSRSDRFTYNTAYAGSSRCSMCIF